MRSRLVFLFIFYFLPFINIFTKYQCIRQGSKAYVKDHLKDTLNLIKE